MRKGFLISWLYSNALPHLPDRLATQIHYKKVFGKSLNLSNPVTFNEKIQWLKLYDHNPEYTTLVDKFAVKQLVADAIGKEYVVPTLGIWKHYDDIDFNKLPNRFVLKCTHDSGCVEIVNDKTTLNHAITRDRFEKILKINYYNYTKEWPYKNVPPQIIAEEYLEDYQGANELSDYKLFFFSGDCKAILVCQHRFSADGLRMTFYDPEWKRFDFTRGSDRTFYPSVEKPAQLDRIIEIGQVLAKEYPLVRMDFYIAHDHVYFGEYTFYPSSGFMKFYPDSWDHVFGDWVELPFRI